MGFINETVSGLEDFITKLNSFLVSDGWTSDELDTVNGEWGISRGTIFAQARWEKPVVASPSFGLYHSLGFINTATLPGNQTDDSGNGAVSGSNATLITQRSVFVGATAVQYWAFTPNSDPRYCHVVLQIDTIPRFVHFGFGLLDKIGDWTGGEYCYGFRQQTGFNNSVAILGGTTILLDGQSADGSFPQPNNMEEYCATVHAEGLPNQVGSPGKWGVCMGNQNGANFGTDRAGEARSRFIGGARGSFLARSFGRFGATSTDGLHPMYPIACWYEDTSQGTVAGATVDYLLGYQKDVRGINIANFVGGDVINIGGDDWYLFPTLLKFVSGALTNTSGHQGWAYKRIN